MLISNTFYKVAKNSCEKSSQQKREEKMVLSTFITVRKSCRPKTLRFLIPFELLQGCILIITADFFICSVLDSAMSDRIY
jgi:hypothetical protein